MRTLTQPPDTRSRVAAGPEIEPGEPLRDTVRLVDGWGAAFDSAEPWTPPTDLEAALVVVPHPDDEAVLFGGLVARLAARRTYLVVLAVTDGDAAYPERVPPQTLARVRRREQRSSLAALGVGGHALCRVGIGDGRVADHEERLQLHIARLLGDRRIGLVVAPWRFDHHTDHEACGRAARGAALAAGRPLLLAGGMFWAPQREPWQGTPLSALSLTNGERCRKRQAIGCHRTQIDEPAPGVAPVLGPDELALCSTSVEHYVIEQIGDLG